MKFYYCSIRGLFILEDTQGKEINTWTHLGDAFADTLGFEDVEGVTT